MAFWQPAMGRSTPGACALVAAPGVQSLAAGKVAAASRAAGRKRPAAVRRDAQEQPASLRRLARPRLPGGARAIRDGKAKLDAIKRFDMPGFRPRKEYVVEMQRFGLLPALVPDAAPLDVYALDRAYWQLLWYRPD